MNIFDYIEEYAKNQGYGEKYILKNKFFSKADMNQQQQMSGGVAFFYKIDILGEIADISNVADTYGSITFDSPTDFYNLGNILTIKDYGSLQLATTDFIFTADNLCTFNLREGANCLFSKIYKTAVHYMYLTPSALYNTNDRRPYAEDKTLDLKLKL